MKNDAVYNLFRLTPSFVTLRRMSLTMRYPYIWWLLPAYWAPRMWYR